MWMFRSKILSVRAQVSYDQIIDKMQRKTVGVGQNAGKSSNFPSKDTACAIDYFHQ